MDIKLKLFYILVVFTSTATARLDVYINGHKFENEKVNVYFNYENPSQISSATIKNAIDDKIIEYLEAARENIPEPIIIEDININMQQKPLIQADLGLLDISVTGMKDFIIELVHLKVLGLTLDFNFFVPDLIYTSKYDLKGKAALVIPLDSSGDLKLSAHGMHIVGNATLGTTSDGYLLLKSLWIDIDIDNTYVSISNLLGIDQLDKVLNWVLDYMSDDFFQGQRDRLDEWISAILFDVIGEAIGNISLGDIIGLKKY